MFYIFGICVLKVMADRTLKRCTPTFREFQHIFPCGKVPGAVPMHLQIEFNGNIRFAIGVSRVYIKVVHFGVRVVA
jgi:hypothetical protein